MNFFGQTKNLLPGEITYLRKSFQEGHFSNFWQVKK
jgi:hypothetical protein